jgi:hypothetical protein
MEKMNPPCPLAIHGEEEEEINPRKGKCGSRAEQTMHIG